MAEKLSVPKPRWMRNLTFFLAFLVQFEDTVNNVDKEMLRNESFRGTNCNLKVSLFVFNYQAVFLFCMLFYFKKNVEDLLKCI